MAVTKQQFTIRLDLADYDRIKQIAEEENRSVANMVETLVKKEIRRYEEAAGKTPSTREHTPGNY
ncbi:MAG: hypothetical protein IK093_06665 [Ruminiclostridium sp.]|nr:hypothetical protein [Ruminiclostridium sp.]